MGKKTTVSKIQKSVIQKAEQKVVKNFGYQKDGINLEFSLRVDVKKDLNIFLELMDAASRDIKNELARLDKESGRTS